MSIWRTMVWSLRLLRHHLLPGLLGITAITIMTLWIRKGETTEEEEEDGTITITMILTIEKAAACPVVVEEIKVVVCLKVEDRIMPLVPRGIFPDAETGEI